MFGMVRPHMTLCAEECGDVVKSVLNHCSHIPLLLFLFFSHTWESHLNGAGVVSLFSIHACFFKASLYFLTLLADVFPHALHPQNVSAFGYTHTSITRGMGK